MSEPSPAAKVGRPARINREMIAAAAHEIGFDGLTLRAVADHLDVSIAALYHHVSGKDDLMRAAAEHAAGSVPLPQDTGQHWAVWLLEWARYNHDVFATRPGLLAEYLDGAIGVETVAPSLDRILGVLVRQGFDVLEANAAYEVVAACSLGAVVNEMRALQVETPVAGAEPGAAERALLDDLPHVRALAEAVTRSGRRPFDARVTTVIRGIAAERDADWTNVAAELDRAAPRRDRR